VEFALLALPSQLCMSQVRIRKALKNLSSTDVYHFTGFVRKVVPRGHYPGYYLRGTTTVFSGTSSTHFFHSPRNPGENRSRETPVSLLAYLGSHTRVLTVLIRRDPNFTHHSGRNLPRIPQHCSGYTEAFFCPHHHIGCIHSGTKGGFNLKFNRLLP